MPKEDSVSGVLRLLYAQDARQATGASSSRRHAIAVVVGSVCRVTSDDVTMEFTPRNVVKASINVGALDGVLTGILGPTSTIVIVLHLCANGTAMFPLSVLLVTHACF